MAVAKMTCGGASRAARDSLDLQGEPGSVLRKPGVGPGFHSSVTRFRRFVARIERSEIRERRSGSIAAPGFRSAQPGLRNKFEGSGTPANADPHPPHLAMRLAPHEGALVYRRSTTALTSGNYSIPKAQLQARLPGTWSERALPAFACPSPGMHLPPRS